VFKEDECIWDPTAKFTQQRFPGALLRVPIVGTESKTLKSVFPGHSTDKYWSFDKNYGLEQIIACFLILLELGHGQDSFNHFLKKWKNYLKISYLKVSDSDQGNKNLRDPIPEGRKMH
jgi:hypothetical protein